MNERERLIELMEQATNGSCHVEDVADYLLENGVIVLPKLKYGQAVYMLYNKKIKQLEVSSYMIRPEFDNLIQIHLYKNGFNGCCTADDIGKTVFLTKEEAEQALRKEDEKR
ncbi:MAG: hypothetical protein IJ285_00920 [Clostridia bacterium]|nr:hypothetical protein [Clostridia bacterium]